MTHDLSHLDPAALLALLDAAIGEALDARRDQERAILLNQDTEARARADLDRARANHALGALRFELARRLGVTS